MADVLTSALSGVEVLDLTDEVGLTGKLITCLRADVILIEKPGGSKARRTEPFKDDVPGTENSRYVLNFNTNKRGIMSDIDMI